MGEFIRVVAFDPGPVWCGFAIAELSAAYRGMVRYGDGGRCQSTMEAVRHVLEAALPPPNSAARLIVAVEQPEGFIHQHARGPQILETARVGGEIGRQAELLGLEVARLPASRWRHALVAKNNASDALIKRACQMFVIGLPVRTNNHVRDALGLAIVALRNPSLATKAAA
jgi:hypothetical protein